MRKLLLILVLGLGFSFDPLNNPTTASNVGFSYISTHVCEKLFGFDAFQSFLITQGLGLLWEMRHSTGVDGNEILANLTGYFSYRFVVSF